MLEEIVAFVVHQDKCREVFHFNFPDGFHPQLRVFHALDALDVVLRKDGRRTTDRTEVEAAVLLAGIGHYLTAVTLSQHNHGTAMALEQVYIRVHTSGSSRAHGAASHALRSLGRTGVVDGMVFDVLRKRFTLIETFLKLSVSDVTSNDDLAGQRNTCRNRMFRQLSAPGSEPPGI